jgi:hypothetical protein
VLDGQPTLDFTICLPLVRDTDTGAQIKWKDDTKLTFSNPVDGHLAPVRGLGTSPVFTEQLDFELAPEYYRLYDTI